MQWITAFFCYGIFVLILQCFTFLKMYRDKSKQINFIQLVKAHPCLYDNNRTDYFDIVTKSMAWDYISNEIHLSVTECKDKWRYLLKRYQQKSNDMPPSGSGMKRKRPYYLDEYLRFIDPFIKPRHSENEEMSASLLSKPKKNILNKRSKVSTKNSSFENENNSLDKFNAAESYYDNTKSQRDVAYDYDIQLFNSIMSDFNTLAPHIRRRLITEIANLVDVARRESSLYHMTDIPYRNDVFENRHTVQRLQPYQAQPQTYHQPISAFSQQLLQRPPAYQQQSQPLSPLQIHPNVSEHSEHHEYSSYPMNSPHMNSFFENPRTVQQTQHLQKSPSFQHHPQPLSRPPSQTNVSEHNESPPVNPYTNGFFENQHAVQQTHVKPQTHHFLPFSHSSQQQSQLLTSPPWQTNVSDHDAYSSYPSVISYANSHYENQRTVQQTQQQLEKVSPVLPTTFLQHQEYAHYPQHLQQPEDLRDDELE